MTDLLRLPPGPVDLADIDTRATPGCDGSKADGEAALKVFGPRLADLQERLFAEGRRGGTRRRLLVLQGMDRTWKRRYDTINRFEAGRVAGSTTVVKCYLRLVASRTS